jgi:hypothetical protein
VVPISHILSAIYGNSNQSSGGTSAMEGYSSKFTIFTGATAPHKNVNMVEILK